MDRDEQEKADKAFFGKGLLWFTIIGIPIVAVAALRFALAENWLVAAIFGIALVMGLFNLRRYREWTHQSD